MRRVCWSLGVSVALALTSLAQGAQYEGTQGVHEGELDEIFVEGRVTLRGLREQMIALEDRFYARYNELNDNPLFDVHCAVEVHTGSRFAKRYCRAVYESRAHQVEGEQHLKAMYDATVPIPPRPWVAPIPATVAIERQRPDFRAAMIRITREHPELVELLHQRAELAERYAAEQRRVLRKLARRQK